MADCCTNGFIIPAFEDDNAACRLGMHGDDCPGGHVGVTHCPEHWPPPDGALILGPCDGCGEPVVDGFVQIDAAKGMLWHWGCRPLDEEGG